MNTKNRPIFYKSGSLPSSEIVNVPQKLSRQKSLGFPQVSEAQAMRHYTYLSTLNHGVDSGFYPLGSCTMKYNYKLLEKVANMPEFNNVHPWQEQVDVQGTLEVMHELNVMLSEILGYSSFTLQPVAGSHGEHTGLLIIRAYLESIGEVDRKVVLVPDTAHGTNPASAAIAGFSVRKVASQADGNLDLDALKKEVANHKVAALMLTNPSTLGLFESQILEIADIVHKAGGLLYYDGANANALLGVIRPGDMGFDVCHLNLHKTFGTPHGGGGPGSGPVGVKDFLVPFLPNPSVAKVGGEYALKYSPSSIGKVHGFYGNVSVLLKAYVYILLHGSDGLKAVSRRAIINANYLQDNIRKFIKLAYDRTCMHEFVISAQKLKKDYGISALDIAKRLIDYGVHPPTIYFPQIVHECLMIEPTESETKESLDDFIEVMSKIVEEAKTNPEIIKKSPQTRVVGRLDEARAVKESKLTAFDIRT